MISLGQFYSFATNTLILGVTDVTDFNTDTGIEYEELEALGEAISLLGGATVFVAIENYALLGTVTLAETSKSINEINGYIRARDAALLAKTRVPGVPWLHRDNANLDLCSESQGAFLSQPLPNKAKSLSDREFQMLLPNAKASLELGAGNI